jgi:hypothetical protein
MTKEKIYFNLDLNEDDEFEEYYESDLIGNEEDYNNEKYDNEEADDEEEESFFDEESDED